MIIDCNQRDTNKYKQKAAIEILYISITAQIIESD